MCCVSPNRLLKSIAAEQTQSRGYICLANDLIVDELVTLDCACNWLEEALRKQAHRLLSLISRVGGRKRECILEEESNVFVLHGETLSHSDLLDERDGAVEAAELYCARDSNSPSFRFACQGPRCSIGLPRFSIGVVKLASFSHVPWTSSSISIRLRVISSYSTSSVS